MNARVAACLLAGFLATACSAQQPAAPAGQDLDQVGNAKKQLQAAESANPSNSVEVAAALNGLISAELDDQGASPETLELAKRELEVAKAAAGERSKAYVSALGDYAEVSVALSHPAEARPYAEQGFEIAQKEFPDSEEGINSADELAFACIALGDFACAKRADETAIAAERKPGPDHEWDLSCTLTNYADLLHRIGDEAGAGAAAQESLMAGVRVKPDDASIGILENNLATHFIRIQNFPLAILHLNRAIEIFTKHYGPDSALVLDTLGNLASAYSRNGQFPLAWKAYETALKSNSRTFDSQANQHADFARALASGGELKRAIDEALTAGRMSRERFLLEVRTLPERQALAYDRVRARGTDTALSVLAVHSELPSEPVYQEVVRSRALVADEMARRQRNLNSSNNPEIARQLQKLNQDRAALLALEQGQQDTVGKAVADATTRMEGTERQLAELSTAIRADERVREVQLEDLRSNLPANAALISYVAFERRAVARVDPAHNDRPGYMAFVLRSGTSEIRTFDLGDAKGIDELVNRLRASAAAEAHASGFNSQRNERTYREAGEALRKLIWDSLRPALEGVKTAIVVPDGTLNLVPFAGLPDGKGYLVERALEIQMLSSERDLIPAGGAAPKRGMLAVGAPLFDEASVTRAASPLRDTPVSCEQFQKIEFQPLPGAQEEVNEIAASWRRWNGDETLATLTGAKATRELFLDEASRNRVLHVATHAFVLDKSCGDGNPLLHSGLVFAGANRSRTTSVLTAEQIASLDLEGVDLAVLSACNTGTGELRDGEGVLGLERAFRIAGVRSVVMTLWPVDDRVTSRYMRVLYDELLKRHASTADAVWAAGRATLQAQRAAGLSTHPWYWAGFVASGWQ